MLFDENTCNDLMTVWPTRPAVYELPTDSGLHSIVTAELLNAYLHTGTAPADNVIVIKEGAALHPRAYTTGGHLDPMKIAKWRGRGYSLQLRTINRWYPPLHTMCSAIQSETGYGAYVTGFVTPAGAQGLNYHWDQNLGVIYQVAGRKTWQIWGSVVEEPHRNHLASNTSPSRYLLDRLRAAGPDQEFDLCPGQVLVLPRGWMHNPHTRGQTEESIHLTFVLRERTGLWISEHLAKSSITSTQLRRVIPPGCVIDLAAFAEQIDETRNLLVDWLTQVDQNVLAAELLDLARTELDVDYI
ncbi:JmjC domain-containing protein [Micromonosporaceae bacterium Da 78-11]